MGNSIIKRCCGNCEWSISPEDEKEIINEYHYAEDDPTRPRAGDCSLGIEHDENYFCNSHEYISFGSQTYTFYEDKYMGPGYFVVSLYDEDIIKFLKLYRTGTYGNYSYGIRVYEYDPIKNNDITGIKYEFRKGDNELLYKTMSIFSKALGGEIIWDLEKKNFMSSNTYEYSTVLYFTGTNNSNYVDIKIDSNMNDRLYRLVEHLYRNMAVTTMNKNNREMYGRVKKITKKN